MKVLLVLRSLLETPTVPEVDTSEGCVISSRSSELNTLKGLAFFVRAPRALARARARASSRRERAGGTAAGAQKTGQGRGLNRHPGPSIRRSGGAVEQPLGLLLQFEPGVLVLLVARQGGNPLHEIKDRFGRLALLPQHRLDDPR